MVALARRVWLAGALAGMWLPAARAQNENAPPFVVSLSWEIARNLTGDPDFGPWGSFVAFDPNNEVAHEGDFVRLTVTATDPDFTTNDTNQNDELFYMVQFIWVQTPPYLSPEPPPIAQAMFGFLPEQNGLQPPSGSTQVTFNPFEGFNAMGAIQIPQFTGPNQGRLNGTQSFDVAWAVLIYLSNDQQPCDIAADNVININNCNSPVTLYVTPGGFFPLLTAKQHPGHQPPNPPPVADAGSDRTVAAGSTIILDGSRTFDAFNVGFDPNSPNVLLKDRLVFAWEWVSGPVRVDPVQDDVHDPKATVTLNQVGTYVFRLTVDDQVNSLPTTDTVTIAVVDSLPVNHAPSAVIVGPADPVPVGTVVTLDGSQSSDPDGDTLNFRWQQTNALGEGLTLDQVRDNFQPLSAMDQPSLSFQALKPGTYYFRLLVDDGAFLSTATFSVTVVEQPESTAATSGSQAPDAGTSGDQGQTGGEPAMEPSAAPTVPACGAGLLPAAILPLVLGFWRLRSR